MNNSSIISKISIFFALFVFLIGAIAVGAFNANLHHQDMDFFDRLRHNQEIAQISPKESESITLNDSELIVLSKQETLKIVQTKTPSQPKHPMDKMPLPPPPLLEDAPHHHPRHDNFLGRPQIYKELFWRAAVFDVDGELLGVQDNASHSAFYIYFSSILATVLIAITLLYMAIIKSLNPLKELEKEIEAFGVGIKPTAKTKYALNEIGKIQKAFYEASAKISALLDAREIFLKNAAHELKTPIAKGVIVAHMLNDERQKGRLLEIFSSMTTIIELIMTAEEVMAKGFSPRVEPILLKIFCEKISKKLLLEPFELWIEVGSNAIVMADPKLLEIALINLIDNAVKFKNSDSVAICAFEGGKIMVKNRGEGLSEPIDRYFEPFFKETSIRNESGMGLGLYLTKKALEIQGLRLLYSHRDGENIFTIS